MMNMLLNILRNGCQIDEEVKFIDEHDFYGNLIKTDEFYREKLVNTKYYTNEILKEEHIYNDNEELHEKYQYEYTNNSLIRKYVYNSNDILITIMTFTNNEIQVIENNLDKSINSIYIVNEDNTKKSITMHNNKILNHEYLYNYNELNKLDNIIVNIDNKLYCVLKCDDNENLKQLMLYDNTTIDFYPNIKLNYDSELYDYINNYENVNIFTLLYKDIKDINIIKKEFETIGVKINNDIIEATIYCNENHTLNNYKLYYNDNGKIVDIDETVSSDGKIKEKKLIKHDNLILKILYDENGIGNQKFNYIYKDNQLVDIHEYDKNNKLVSKHFDDKHKEEDKEKKDKEEYYFTSSDYGIF